jgi:hypothetical protein
MAWPARSTAIVPLFPPMPRLMITSLKGADMSDRISFEIGDLVLVSGEYEAIIISWNDDGTATVQSEATGNKYNVDPEILEHLATEYA